MSSRAYLSGSAKRKLKMQKDTAKKKIANSLDNFITVERKSHVVDVPSDHVQPNATCEIAEQSSEESNSILNLNFSEEQSDEIENNVDNTTSYDLRISANENALPFDTDPAMWTIIDNEMVEYFIRNPPSQNMGLLPETERVFGDVKRSLTVSQFYHTKINGEKLLRKWLVLSVSSKMVYCWVCKLLHSNSSSSSCKGQLVSGFCDWKHAASRLKEHENSASHKQAMMNVSLRSNATQRIDSSIIQQYEEETKYWISVLKRVVAVIKFLAFRGLPFFGDNETIGSKHNGNFLGCLEVIAEFDPFLSRHLEKYGNPGKGNISYLSSTCVDQFIAVMATKVRKHIIEEILLAKYYSIIVDSTPDITHLDQLCFVIRYVLKDQPVERFLGFIPMFSHKSETLVEIVLTSLNEAGIDILNCRGQSYDNASNMAGKYSGLQARIKNINPAADFVPCAAHSLNLVGVNAVESCSGVMQFFSFVQQIYNFFSASTHRWQALSEELKKSGNFLTIKNHCVTRWCADAHAVKSLRKNYHMILLTLTRLGTDGNENASTRSEAQVLLKRLKKLETVLNIVVWDTLLQRLHQTSTQLQKSSINLTQVILLYQSLIDFTQYVRDNFDEYEKLAKDICEEKDYEVSRKKMKPRSKDPHAINSSEVDLAPREMYITTIFNAICDSLIMQLSMRKTTYDNTAEKFACVTNIKEKSTIRDKAVYLQELYPYDLDDSFPDELQQFSSLVENENNIADMFKKLKHLQLDETFPNVDSALRIFLTLPVSNCSGERSFSLLKRLKSPVRSSILQEKLSSLAILCVLKGR